MLTTHVDDLLYSHFPEAKEIMDALLGGLEESNVRYGKAFGEEDGVPTILVKDHARAIRRVQIDSGRKLDDELKPDDITKLRSAV